jgi:AcrR family transcriptional regulator
MGINLHFQQPSVTGDVCPLLCYLCDVAQAPTAEPSAVPRQLRADAANNRRRILEAARAIFAERGIDAPLDDIARQAGVGNATLYRRFPTRDVLVATVFEARVAEYADAATEALRGPDPWVGFCQFAQRVFAMQAADRGLSDVLTMTARTTERLAELRQRAYQDFAQLVRRAQAAGELRADFVPEDFILLVLANQGVLRGTEEAAPLAWQRFLALVLDGCRAEGAHALSSPPPADGYAATRGLVRPKARSVNNGPIP